MQLETKKSLRYGTMNYRSQQVTLNLVMPLLKQLTRFFLSNQTTMNHTHTHALSTFWAYRHTRVAGFTRNQLDSLANVEKTGCQGTPSLNTSKAAAFACEFASSLFIICCFLSDVFPCSLGGRSLDWLVIFASLSRLLTRQTACLLLEIRRPWKRSATNLPQEKKDERKKNKQDFRPVWEILLPFRHRSKFFWQAMPWMRSSVLKGFGRVSHRDMLDRGPGRNIQKAHFQEKTKKRSHIFWS